MTFWMSTADWMELQAYRATGLTPDAVQEMVSFPYTADDDEEVNKLIANQCVVCGAERPEGDQGVHGVPGGQHQERDCQNHDNSGVFGKPGRKANGCRTGRGGADAERGQGMTTKQAREQVKSRIGDLIRDNLELCELTARDLIEELGIEHAHLNAWLTGRCLPSLPAALAMARLFGVTVEQLALGDDAE